MKPLDLSVEVRAARHYQGAAFSPNLLEAPDFRALLDRRAGDPGPYLVHYSGARRQCELSYQRYVGLCRHLAQQLREVHSVAPGDVVMVALGNSVAALVAYGALLALGAVVAPVNPEESDATIRFIADDCDAVGCLYNGLTRFASSPAGFSLRLEDAEVLGAPDAEAWPDVASPGAEAPALLIYTSGTTGRSKGVLLDQGNLLINAEATRRLHSMDAQSTHMTVLPVFHVNAFVFSFVTCLYAGSRLVLNRSFYLPAFWQILEAERVDVVSVVPAIIRQLLDDRREIGHAQMPASLRYLVTAAAPLSTPVLEAFLARFGRRVVQGYGLSEAVNFSLTVPPDLPEDEYRKAMLAPPRPPAGVAVFGNEVAVLDEAGRELGEGEEGEIALRGWNLMRGYVGAPDITAAAFRGGWLHTGDKGCYRDMAGRRFYYLSGRLKEVAKRLGESINLLDIDEALLGLPGLGSYAAVAFGNDAVGEEIGLFVVAGETALDPAAILAACRSRLPAHLCPKAVVFGETLPRTPTGKIQRTALAVLFVGFEHERFRG